VPDVGHEGPVLALAVSPDKLHFLSGGEDHAARVWNASATRALRVLDQKDGQVTAACFSSDSKEALTGADDGSLELWDMQEGADLKRFPGPAPVGGVSFSPQGWLRAACTDGTLHVFSREKPKSPIDLGTKAAAAPAVVAGKLALLGSEKGPIKVWDLDTGRELRTLDARPGVRVLALSASGKRALAGGSGVLKVFDVSSGTELRGLDVGTLAVTAVAISDDDAYGLSALEDGEVRLFDLNAGQRVDSIPLGASRDLARSAVFTREGFLVGTGRGVVLRFEWLGA
jgi:WD40 repeat protein